MHLEYKVQGGNFSKAGHASGEIKKVLKQLNVNPMGRPRMKGFLAVGLKALILSTMWLAAQRDIAS